METERVGPGPPSHPRALSLQQQPHLTLKCRDTPKCSSREKEQSSGSLELPSSRLQSFSGAFLLELVYVPALRLNHLRRLTSWRDHLPRTRSGQLPQRSSLVSGGTGPELSACHPLGQPRGSSNCPGQGLFLKSPTALSRSHVTGTAGGLKGHLS